MLEKSFAYFGMFALSFSFWSMAAIFLFRSGLEIPFATFQLSLSFVATIVFFPFVLGNKVRARLEGKIYVYLFAFFILFYTPLLGHWFGSSLPIIFIVLGVWGAVRALPHLKDVRVWEWALLIGGPAILAFHVLGPGQFQTLYGNEGAVFGHTASVTFLNTAIANIFKHFGIASAGVDGIYQLHYHTASHVWFSMMSKMSNTVPLLVYPTCLLMVIIPFLFWSFFVSCMALANVARRPAVIAILGSALVIVGDKLSWGLKTDIHTMPSFTMSVALFLLATAGVFCFIKSTVSATEEKFVAGLLVLIAGAMCILKITTGSMLIVVIVYLFAKKKGIFSPFTIVLGILSFITIAMIARTFSPQEYYGISPQLLFSSYGQMFTLDYMYPYVFPLVYCMYLYLNPEWKYDSGTNEISFRGRFRNRSFKKFFSEILFEPDSSLKELLFVTIVVAIFMIIALRVGSPASYYLSVETWLAYVIFMSRFSFSPSPIWKRLLVFLFLPILPLVYIYELQDRLNEFSLHRKKITSRMGIEERTSLSAFLKNRALFSPEFVEALEKNYWWQLVKVIKSEAQASNNKLAVYVPKTNTDFWMEMPKGYAYECAVAHYYFPSLTGAPILAGLSEEDRFRRFDNMGVWLDYECADRNNLTPHTDTQLCELAKQRGFSLVMIVPPGKDINAVRKLSCH